jgi:hypothetical protein
MFSPFVLITLLAIMPRDGAQILSDLRDRSCPSSANRAGGRERYDVERASSGNMVGT